MAAYAALFSLMHIIKQIQQHPYPPISLDNTQAHSLTKNITFLQGFLESSGSKEDEDLESRIADTAYAAEDVIESHIVDQIHAGSTSHGEKISSVDQFYQGLQEVIQGMDLIKRDAETIKEKMGVQDQLHRNSSISTGSIGLASKGESSTIVGCDDDLIEIMDKLTGQEDNLQVIPIVGMGGIGKTTLARNIYTNPLIVGHFDILAWVTISQEYSRREILSQVLCQQDKWSMNDLIQMSEDELGESVYKSLLGRRYLIVMDDIWSIDAWDKVKFFFPDNNYGSRIMITTRLSNLALNLSGSHGFQMKFLDEDTSWNLFCEIVFGEEVFPSELVDVGKKIAKNCRGLPLSIVVIGGLLAKSNMTREYWEHTSENLNSLINLENNEHCLQILRTSYKELPIHLKPCFLYMGAFPEDHEIRVSELIKLWVAEGFLKPNGGESLEVAAEKYLEQLIDRNLILVHKLGWNGKVKFCKIHDLLRDLCLGEAQKQRFLCVLRQRDDNIPQGINLERRICIRKDTQNEYSPQFLRALESASLTRSLLLVEEPREPSPSSSFRLLRVYTRIDRSRNQVGEALFQQANLRYLSVIPHSHSLSEFPSSFSLLWNLQTLTVVTFWIRMTAPSEIWKMPQLRHVKFTYGLELPDPPSGEGSIVLKNLQTLSLVYNFKCSEEVVERIPNVKKLVLLYDRLEEDGLPHYCRNKLVRLQKLESLRLDISSAAIVDPKTWWSPSLTFPQSLNKLTLSRTNLRWEDLATRIGSLPHLEVLKLRERSCMGVEWRTVEGPFCGLKFLQIQRCDLRYWTTDSTHFSRLEHLVLQVLCLEEIPTSIGDIPTLRSIQLRFCSVSAGASAIRIRVEQEELGNEGLTVEIGKSSTCNIIHTLGRKLP